MKVFGTILKRFQSERDQRTCPNQSGFRPGHRCTDQVHNLRRTLEQRLSFRQASLILLLRIIAADGMTPKLLKLIKACYSSTKMTIRANCNDSMPFEIHAGDRQGCALSPTLLNYIMDWILGHSLSLTCQHDFFKVYNGLIAHKNCLAPPCALTDSASSLKYKNRIFTGKAKPLILHSFRLFELTAFCNAKPHSGTID